MVTSEQIRTGNPTHRSVSSEGQENTNDVRQIEPDDEATISPTMNEEHDPLPIGDDDDFDCFETNDRLIDELERILQGDFAPDDSTLSETDAITETDFPLTEPSPEPEFAVKDADEFDSDDNSWDDPEPAEDDRFQRPQATNFWLAAEPERSRPGITAAPRARNPVGRYTIATILLMIVAGGAYAYVQLSGDPVVPLDGETAIAAASPIGAGSAPTFTADDLAANPGETNVGEPAAEPETFTPDPVAVAQNPVGEATPATIQPRLVQTVPVLEPTPGETAGIGGGATDRDPVDATPPPADDGLGGPLIEPETPAASPVPAGAAVAPPGATPATTNNWVNLRDGPGNDANVILTVPQGVTVDVVACDPWCEVYYEGTRGWIWQDYVDLP